MTLEALVGGGGNPEQFKFFICFLASSLKNVRVKIFETTTEFLVFVSVKLGPSLFEGKTFTTGVCEHGGFC